MYGILLRILCYLWFTILTAFHDGSVVERKGFANDHSTQSVCQEKQGFVHRSAQLMNLKGLI